MHSSSIRNLERFFKVYLNKFDNPKVLDLGGAKKSKMNGLDILKKLNYKFLYTINKKFQKIFLKKNETN